MCVSGVCVCLCVNTYVYICTCVRLWVYVCVFVCVYVSAPPAKHYCDTLEHKMYRSVKNTYTKCIITV